MVQLWEYAHVPFTEWTNTAVDTVLPTMRPFFQAIKVPIQVALHVAQTIFTSAPPLVVLCILFLLAWQIAGIPVALFCVAAMVFIGLIGVWQATMLTLAVILTAIFFCLIIGMPLGVLAARNDRFNNIIRPVLDTMQTIPAFVYMIPIVMLLGIGNVPGVVVTAVFALPPVIRLTNLGLREVPFNLIEAAHAFGSSPREILFKIRIPLATSTIMAGVNQTLMMALAMVVIASMISVDGLGMLVLQGIGRLNVGLAASGGVGIVLLAMILDRLTEALGATRRNGKSLSCRGPIGLLVRLVR